MLFSIKPDKIRKFNRNNNGFTLVELLVAAVIVLVSVVAVIAVVRKSTEMQINDYHRRQARAAIMQQFEASFSRLLEGTDYSVTVEQLTVVGGDGSDKDDLVIKSSDQFISPDAGFVPWDGIEFILDDRNVTSLSQALTGRIFFRVTSGNESVVMGGVPQDVPVHNVTIKVTWKEVGETNDESVELTKRLARVIL